MKRILIVVSIFIISKNTTAQFSFGAKAGAGISKTNTANPGLKTKRVKAFAGGYINYRFKNKIALQAELIYSGDGIAPVAETSTVKRRIKSGKFRIPFMLQYKLPENWSVETGIQFKNTLTVTQTPDGSKSVNIEELYQTGNFGILFGGTYKCRGRWSGLKIGVRYNIEFPKINGTGTNSLKRGINISLSCPILKNKASLMTSGQFARCI